MAGAAAETMTTGAAQTVPFARVRREIVMGDLHKSMTFHENTRMPFDKPRSGNVTRRNSSAFPGFCVLPRFSLDLLVRRRD
ncbi:hypothetical protein CKW39_05190 [Kocuria sp. WRN011]|nr:hypothetical protein CKW39_05190 [Kocuria sp. WRN011]PZP27250.1 MAG: hypothetical protein DI613_14235 [Kocuria rhizophila]